MEEPPNNPPPASDPSTRLPPVLPYQVPEEDQPRWGTTLSKQLSFGFVFCFFSIGIVVQLANFVAVPVAVLVGIGCILIAVYIGHKWRWRGFVMGILLFIGLAILSMGLC